MRLILASKSEARARLLRSAGYAFRQVDSGVEETPPRRGEPLARYVARLARAKAMAAGAEFPESVVIGCDTALSLDGRIMGKPADLAGAVGMLASLAGRVHRLASALCVLGPRRGRLRPVRVGVDVARVTIRAWSEARIRKYVMSVQPVGYAGAYALQSDGAAIIERIEGDPSTVIGLPMSLVGKFLSDVAPDV